MHGWPRIIDNFQPSISTWAVPAQQLRYNVFRDMYQRGYYLTTGAKFGGDFLAYPGDPHRFHAHHVVIAVPWEEVLSPLEIVSLGRLGTVVHKAPLVGSVSPEGEVCYLSLEWTGAN